MQCKHFWPRFWVEQPRATRKRDIRGMGNDRAGTLYIYMTKYWHKWACLQCIDELPLLVSIKQTKNQYSRDSLTFPPTGLSSCHGDNCIAPEGNANGSAVESCWQGTPWHQTHYGSTLNYIHIGWGYYMAPATRVYKSFGLCSRPFQFNFNASSSCRPVAQLSCRNKETI